MIAVICVLALAAGALAYERLGRSAEVHEKHRRSAIKITGAVENLFPGQPATLDVVAVNRTRRPLVVTKVKARALPAGLGCPASVLSISPARPRAPLAPRGSTTVRLRAVLTPTATSACEGATWPLRFRARAVTTRRAK